MAASSAHGSAQNASRRPGRSTSTLVEAKLMLLMLIAGAAEAFGTLYQRAYMAVGEITAELGLSPAGHPAQATTRAHNMIGTAITFGLALMIALVMMIVTGMFIANAPTSGAFQGAINTAKDIGSAGYVIIAVVLLVIPVVGLIGYFVNSGLGGFISGGAMGGNRRR